MSNVLFEIGETPIISLPKRILGNPFHPVIYGIDPECFLRIDPCRGGFKASQVHRDGKLFTDYSSNPLTWFSQPPNGGIHCVLPTSQGPTLVIVKVGNNVDSRAIEVRQRSLCAQFFSEPCSLRMIQVICLALMFVSLPSKSLGRILVSRRARRCLAFSDAHIDNSVSFLGEPLIMLFCSALLCVKQIRFGYGARGSFPYQNQAFP